MIHIHSNIINIQLNPLCFDFAVEVKTVFNEKEPHYKAFIQISYLDKKEYEEHYSEYYGLRRAIKAYGHDVNLYINDFVEINGNKYEILDNSEQYLTMFKHNIETELALSIL